MGLIFNYDGVATLAEPFSRGDRVSTLLHSGQRSADVITDALLFFARSAHRGSAIMPEVFSIKQYDLLDPLESILRDSLGVAINPLANGATLYFSMRTRDSKTVVIPPIEATTVAVVDPFTGETVSAARYEWAEGDTDVAGAYQAEFAVRQANGSTRRYPNPGYISVLINEAVLVGPFPPPLEDAVRVVGPYRIDHADLPNEGDQVTLFTPTVGDIVLEGFIDIESSIPWDDPNPVQLFLGRSPSATSFIGKFAVGFTFTGTMPMTWNQRQTDGVLSTTGMYRFASDDPVVAVASDGVTAPGDPLPNMTGRVDLYFVIATPVAP